MLSYQHGYHAGNLADVHKHAALAWVLDYLMQKDKPLSYLETHAGRGLYDLTSPEAKKTGEAAMGITRALDRFPKSHPYARAIARTRADHGPAAYPGSPLIAAQMLRDADVAHVADAHPAEHAALLDAMAAWPVSVHHQDGLQMAFSLTAPTPRRGLMLVDPSYEVKTEYEAMPHFLYKIHRKWNVGVLMLWYPVLNNGAQAQMCKVLDACNFPGAIRHEVRFKPVRAGHGMVGSGLFVVNAPYGMDRALNDIARAIPKT